MPEPGMPLGLLRRRLRLLLPHPRLLRILRLLRLLRLLRRLRLPWRLRLLLRLPTRLG